MALDIGLPNDPDLTKKWVESQIKIVSDKLEAIEKKLLTIEEIQEQLTYATNEQIDKLFTEE